MFRCKFFAVVLLGICGCSEPGAVSVPDGPEAGIRAVSTLIRRARFQEALDMARAMVGRFRDHPRSDEIQTMASALESVVANESELLFAVRCLDSDNDGLVRAARNRLRGGGVAAAMVLKNVAASGKGRLSLQASELLDEIAASAGVAATIEKMRNATSDSERAKLGKSLADMIGDDVDDATVRALYPMLGLDRGLKWRDLVGVLCRYYTNELGKDGERLNSLIGDPAAYLKLRGYVRRALESEDASHREWASEHIATFGLMLSGLRGSYYEGLEFEKLVHERLDPNIDIPNRQFPYPDKRQDNISVRWTGMIRIPRSGKYIFTMASDDGQRLWVAGEQLVDDWNYHGVIEVSGEITLEKGSYPFQAEFMQGEGGAETHVYWQGPGIKKQIVPKSAFRTMPW